MTGKDGERTRSSLLRYNPTKKIPERTPEARSGYHANASLFWVKICKLASFGHSLPDAQEAIQVEQRLTLIAKEAGHQLQPPGHAKLRMSHLARYAWPCRKGKWVCLVLGDPSQK